MSRTDVHRPYWVKMLDKPGNYKAVHNHGKRMLLDKNGKIVDVPTGEFWPNGREKRRTIYVNHPTCDLPASPWDRDDRPYSYNACHYTHTHSWVSTGEAHCGCPMCSDTVGRKQETRKKRRMAKRETQDWEKLY